MQCGIDLHKTLAFPRSDQVRGLLFLQFGAGLGHVLRIRYGVPRTDCAAHIVAPGPAQGSNCTFALFQQALLEAPYPFFHDLHVATNLYMNRIIR